MIQWWHPYAYLAADSFTYFTLVRQVYDSHLLFSYSGLDHTTGIHPGFYFLLIPVYLIAGINLPSWSLVIGSVLILAASGLIYLTYGPAPAVGFWLLLLTPYGITLTNNGMESALVIFILSLLTYLLSRPSPPPLLLGLILGLGVAARLDLIFLGAAFYSWFLIKRLFSWRSFGLVSLGFGLPLIIIAGLNLYFGGSIMPVSGALKSSFPGLTADWLANLWRLKIFLIATLIMCGYLIHRYLIKVGSPELIIPILGMAVIGLYVYNALFMAGIGAWYGVLPVFTIAIIISLLLRDMSPLRRWLSSLVAIAAIVIIVSHFYFAAQKTDWISPHQIAAAWLLERARSGEAAGELKDGVFAFYAKLPVYSLTGLANNHDYGAAIRRGELPAYLAARNINYVVGFDSGVQVPGGEQLFRSCREAIYEDEWVTIYPVRTCLPPPAGL